MSDGDIPYLARYIDRDINYQYHWNEWKNQQYKNTALTNFIINNILNNPEMIEKLDKQNEVAILAEILLIKKYIQERRSLKIANQLAKIKPSQKDRIVDIVYDDTNPEITIEEAELARDDLQNKMVKFNYRSMVSKRNKRTKSKSRRAKSRRAKSRRAKSRKGKSRRAKSRKGKSRRAKSRRAKSRRAKSRRAKSRRAKSRRVKSTKRR